MVGVDDGNTNFGCGLMRGLFCGRRTTVRLVPINTTTAANTVTASVTPTSKASGSGNYKSRPVVGASAAAEPPRKLDNKRISKPPSLPSVQTTTRSSDSPGRSTSSSSRASLMGMGNVALLGQMANLANKKGNGNSSTNRTGFSKTSSGLINGGDSLVAGNIIVRRKSCGGGGGRLSSSRFGASPSGSDSEALNAMGNEKYRQGRVEEALALYDRAIVVDSENATLRGNRGAALMRLGRLAEAVNECLQAVRIQPSYQSAHQRLGTLYLRLGEAEKALHHYRPLGRPIVEPKEMARAQALKTCLTRCTQAQELGDWRSLLERAHCAIASGADSAPQVFAMQAEALLRLHRHQEASSAFRQSKKFDIGSCVKLFGLAAGTYMLSVEAQIHLAMGRFEDAVATVKHAVRLDSGSEEASAVLRRINAVAMTRSRGNRLFEASKFTEACVAYSEGLEHEPHNSVLLSNRAACRYKLGQFERSVEDCSVALAARPSYGKARLRRAHSYAKLERWEASIQDCEMLMRDTPGDENVGRALFEAQVQLRKQRGEDVEDMEFGSKLVSVYSNQRFRHLVTSPGMSVVLFCERTCHKQVMQLMEQVCKKFPAVHFLKVEVEDHPYLVKLEGVSSVPAFKIYKNGSRVKDIPGHHRHLLENCVRLYSRS